MNIQQIKKQNAIQNKIAQALADIRVTRLEQFISGYKNGNLTADEVLTLTDNILQDELKQSIGR